MILPAIKSFCIRFSVPIILMSWLLLFFLHLDFYGVITDLESKKYIAEAENLISNKGLSAPRFWYYSITIIIIAVSLKIKIGFIGAVFIQSFLNLLAILFFHKSLKLIFKQSSLNPFIIICIIITFSPYSSWNVFLFTESIFYSSILVLISTIFYHNYNKKTFNALAVIFALTITILSRPLGVLFIPAVLFYFYTNLSQRLKFIILPVAIIGAGVLFYITNIVFTTTTDATITLSAKQGCVVCGIIPAKEPQLILLKDGSPMQQLSYYISHNFFHFLLLAVQRGEAFFFIIRPYYSTFHNFFILIFIIPLYTLSIISFGIQKEKKYKPVFYFMFISVATFAIAVILQCDDYHNRFILGLFPFFLIFSAKAIAFKKNNLTSLASS